MSLGDYIETADQYDIQGTQGLHIPGDNFIDEELLSNEYSGSIDIKSNELGLVERNFTDTLKELSEINSNLDEATLKSLQQSYDEIQAASNKPSSIIHPTESKLVFITPETDENGGIEEYKYSEESRWQIKDTPKPIDKYTEDDIKTWSKTLTAQKEQEPDLPEFIAIVKRANFLFCKQELRDVQILSLLLYLQDGDKEALLQIKTGEGKTTITAGLASILALKGHKVDIISSTPHLAKDAAIEREKFFEMFGLTVAHNQSDENSSQEMKKCYNADIVYGSISNFQSDYLRNLNKKIEDKSKTFGRGEREFDVVIIDEVDNILVDGASDKTLLSSPIPGIQHINVIYALGMWMLKQFETRIACINDSKGRNTHFYIKIDFSVEDNHITLKIEESSEDKQPREKIKEIKVYFSDTGKLTDNEGQDLPEDILEKVLYLPDKDHARSKYLRAQFNSLCVEGVNPDPDSKNHIHLPSFLDQMCKVQKNVWPQNAQNAIYTYQKDKDYIVESKIIPVSNMTGVLQTNTSLSNGLNQFLEILYELKLTPESLITQAISNQTFLKFYKKMFGLTGTLGNELEQKIAIGDRPLNTFFIPTNKPSKFCRYDSVITENAVDHFEALENSIKNEIERNRAVLVICPNIQFLCSLHDYLLPKYEKIRIYYKGDKSDSDNVGIPVEAGDIIIATNLAGRGTDIKTTEEVEKNKGLHVILTYLPFSQREEDQNMGRTARQGKEGSGQIILNRDDIVSLGIPTISTIQNFNFDKIKQIRDEKAEIKVKEKLLYECDDTAQKDNLIEKLREFSEELLPKNIDKIIQKIDSLENKKIIGLNNAKQKQLNEDKGVFLRQVENELRDEQKYENFKDNLRTKGFEPLGLESTFIYSVLSQQIGFQLMAEDLKFIIIQKLATDHKIKLEDCFDQMIEILKNTDDQKILETVAEILELNIFVITQDKDSKIIEFQITKNTDSQHFDLFLAIFVNAKTGKITYQALKPLFETGIKIKQMILDNAPPQSDVLKNYLNKIYFEVEKKKALEVNEKAKNIIDSKLEDFKSKVRESYDDKNYKFIVNPAYLTSYGSIYGDTEALEKATEKDKKFSYAAHHNLAYLLIKKGAGNAQGAENPDRGYILKAQNALAQMQSQLENHVIPQIEALCAYVIKNNDSSQLAKQLMARKKICELIIEHLKSFEDIFSKVNSETKKGGKPKYFLGIEEGSRKPLESIWNDSDCEVPEDEFLNFNVEGLQLVFKLKLYEIPDPPKDYFAGMFLVVTGIAQIGIAILCMSACPSLAISLAIEGFKDIMTAVKVFEGAEFNWENYYSEKGIRLVVIAATALVSVGLQEIGLLSSTTSLGATSFTESAKALGIEIATNMAMQYTVDKGIEKTVDLAVGEFEGKIKKTITEKINNYFSRQDVKDKISEIVGAGELEELYSIICSSLEQDQNKLTEICKGVLRNVGEADDAHLGLKIASKVLQGVEAVKAVDEISSHLSEIIGNIDSRIEEKLKTIPNDEQKLKEELKSLRGHNTDDIIAILKNDGIIDHTGKIKKENINEIHLPEDCNTIKIRDELFRICSQHEYNSDEIIKPLQNTMIDFCTKHSLGQVKRYVFNPLFNLAISKPLGKVRQWINQKIHDTFSGISNMLDNDKEEAQDLDKVLKEQQDILDDRTQVFHHCSSSVSGFSTGDHTISEENDYLEDLSVVNENKNSQDLELTSSDSFEKAIVPVKKVQNDQNKEIIDRINEEPNPIKFGLNEFSLGLYEFKTSNVDTVLGFDESTRHDPSFLSSTADAIIKIKQIDQQFSQEYPRLSSVVKTVGIKAPIMVATGSVGLGMIIAQKGAAILGGEAINSIVGPKIEQGRDWAIEKLSEVFEHIDHTLTTQEREALSEATLYFLEEGIGLKGKKQTTIAYANKKQISIELKYEAPDPRYKPARDVVKNKPFILREAIHDYEEKSGFKLSLNQKREIFETLRKEDFSKPLDKSSTDLRRGVFKAEQTKLIKAFEEKNGQPWLTKRYIEVDVKTNLPIIDKNTGLAREIVIPAQYHHAIPLKQNGPDSLGFPAFKESHIGKDGIHRKGGPLDRIFKTPIEDKK